MSKIYMLVKRIAIVKTPNLEKVNNLLTIWCFDNVTSVTEIKIWDPVTIVIAGYLLWQKCLRIWFRPLNKCFWSVYSIFGATFKENPPPPNSIKAYSYIKVSIVRIRPGQRIDDDQRFYQLLSVNSRWQLLLFRKTSN